jgi:hypothetical protein
MHFLWMEVPFFVKQRAQVIALAKRYAFPATYAWREFTLAGGLMSYGASLTVAARQTAVYVSKILKGAQPADLPVLQPTKLDLDSEGVGPRRSVWPVGASRRGGRLMSLFGPSRHARRRSISAAKRAKRKSMAEFDRPEKSRLVESECGAVALG